MLVQAWKSADNMKLANDLVRSAEVVIYGSIKSYKWITARLNDGKLTFECGERWLKRGWLNILSPRLLRAQWLYHTNYYNKPLYRLNASAYAADDMKKLHSFKGRCYKWGYFTAVRIWTLKLLYEREQKRETVFYRCCAIDFVEAC